MKKTLAGLLLTILCAGVAFGQNSDVAPTIKNFAEKPQLKKPGKSNKDETTTSSATFKVNSGKQTRLLSNAQHAFSVNNDRKKESVFYATCSKFAIPSALLLYGVLTQKNSWLRELDLSTRQEVNKRVSKKIRIDDYMQFASSVAVVGVDAFGVKTRHSFRDRAFVLGTSHLIMFMGVHSLKIATKVRRPDGSNNRSFPSGHTATAFVGAHALFRECRETAPWLCFAGYAMACGTGAMRVYNDKHWVSDVVAGAGIGMLSVELSYLLLPVFHSIIGKKETKNNLVMLPVVGNKSYGVGLSCSF